MPSSDSEAPPRDNLAPHSSSIQYLADETENDSLDTSCSGFDGCGVWTELWLVALTIINEWIAAGWCGGRVFGQTIVIEWGRHSLINWIDRDANLSSLNSSRDLSWELMISYVKIENGQWTLRLSS